MAEPRPAVVLLLLLLAALPPPSWCALLPPSEATPAPLQDVAVYEAPSTRCLTHVKEVQPQRFLFYDGYTVSLGVASSLRPAHRLLSHAFATFLREVLGYASVVVDEINDTLNASMALRPLHAPPHDERLLPPKSMVNLEVPLPPNLDLHSEGVGASVDMEDCGNLGPVGRFGWFIPAELQVTGGRASAPALDHWRTFTRPEWASTFAQNPARYAPYLKNPITDTFYCDGSTEFECHSGMFVPPQCNSSRVACALLLADYYEDTRFVVQQVTALKLYVKVLWVGPNLTSQVEEAAVSGRPVVGLAWHPGPLSTSRQQYSSVSFPPCEPGAGPGAARWPCDTLALHRLVKAVWSPLKDSGDSAKAAYEAIHRVHLTSSEYSELLQRAAKAGPAADIQALACTWLRDKQDVWRHWEPPDKKERTMLIIGGIFPMGGTTYTAKGIMAAANMAVKAVNNNTNILRDYQLSLRAFDGQCKADIVMKSFIDYIRLPQYDHLVGILGPACSDTVEPLAGVSRHYRTVIISYSAEGSSFSDRQKYPYFFRTIGENKQYKYVYLQLLRRLGWRRVAALTEDGQKYTEYISHMQDLLQHNGIHFVTNRKFPREREAAAMTQYLEDLKSKSARIIIADVYDDAARAVMCEAYHLGMTGKQGYVWFLPLWLSPHWYDADHFNAHYNETLPCSTAQMVEAINGHLALAHAYFASDEAPMQIAGQTVGEWRHSYERMCRAKNVSQSNYAGYAYDAVWTYAYALQRLADEDQAFLAKIHSEDATRSFVKHLSNTDFHGVSGHIKFLNGPSRVSIINVVQWLNNSTRIVGSFTPNISDTNREIIGGVLELNVSAIAWMTADGLMPEDGTEPPPTCFVSAIADFFNTTCEIAIVIVNLLGFGVLGAVLFAVFILMKRRYERMTERYMKSMGIDLLPTSSFSSLDKWEIAREHVVINRKLGEGAFGTVYGGEANLPDKGWAAVAVKTLKVGSSTEVKLDFLSEAEVMKRLDHQNIVHLLGVCTKSEPVYTVMEFMLYGDLKTFLLARRHLVSERSSEESDEISSKKLTNMALDIARALTYLADLKFVHRDVACRNCMVNANRVVKLGDFGMTRAMHESDYYKFSRKGMLPVRWMAPESLGLGIFTPQSDIWSYGVLLYEIITFGSFPFQGMSNSQVLEYVKAGNTLTIPKGVKPQLEGLLRNCWLQDHKKRPHALEIVEFLANNPRLISPCLDVPLASVQMEDTGQMELQLPEKSRKCSVSLKARHRSLSGGSTASPGSHPATTPNSPTTLEPPTKLARSATAQDPLLMPQSPTTIPLLPAPPGHPRLVSPDTVPLLLAAQVAGELDLLRRAASPPHENGCPPCLVSPVRRPSAPKFYSRPENGDAEQAMSIL